MSSEDKVYVLYFQSKLSKNHLWLDKDPNHSWMIPHSMYYFKEDCFDARLQLNNDIDEEYRVNNRYTYKSYEPNDLPSELQADFDKWMETNQPIYVFNNDCDCYDPNEENDEEEEELEEELEE